MKQEHPKRKILIQGILYAFVDIIRLWPLSKLLQFLVSRQLPILRQSRALSPQPHLYQDFRLSRFSLVPEEQESRPSLKILAYTIIKLVIRGRTKIGGN